MPPHEEVGWPDDEAWQVLELVALHQGLDAAPDERVELLSRPDFDHGRLVEQAMRHGLLPAFADFLIRHGLRKQLPARLRAPVMAYLRFSEHRAQVLTKAAEHIAAGMAGAGLRVAFTKGVVLQSTLYDVLGLRSYNDIDMMISPGDRESVRSAMIALGYEAATTFDPVTRSLRKISRETELVYRMSPDHLPHFRQLTADVCVEEITVDVANSMTWHASSWQVPMEPVMAAVEPVVVLGKASLPSLSSADSFLFLCLHLFREGWIQRNIGLKDLGLVQFVDIVRHWSRSDSTQRQSIRESIEDRGLAKPVAWACGHTDALFGTGIVTELGLTAQASQQWLASAQGSQGRQLTWSGDMRLRLRSPRPVRLSAAGEGQ